MVGWRGGSQNVEGGIPLLENRKVGGFPDLKQEKLVGFTKCPFHVFDGSEIHIQDV